MVRQAPMRQLHSNRHCCLWKWPHRKANQSIRRCHPQAKKSASQAVLSRMQLTLHATRRTPHGAPCLVLAMSTWPVKSRRALSRHCRDVRVYGHTTMAMYDMSTPPRRVMIVSCGVYMARHPRGAYVVHLLLSLEVATPENK